MFTQRALNGGLLGLLAATIWNRLWARSRVRARLTSPVARLEKQPQISQPTLTAHPPGPLDDRICQ